MEEGRNFPLLWEKLAAAVAYLTEKSRNDERFGETKLVKLLYYSDCAAYLRTGQPITGITYVHMQYGPYPDNWRGLLRRLQDDRIIDVIDEGVARDYQRHLPISSVSTDTSALTEREQRLLDEQLHRFTRFNAVQIVEYSHDELAWRVTQPGRVLPYELAGIRIPGPPDEGVRQRAQRISDSIREHGYRIANDVTPRQ